MNMTEDLSRMLCPPGNGVFTVQTAREKKEALHRQLYATTDAEAVAEGWRRQLEQALAAPPSAPLLLGICSDSGGGIMRGANWGPLFVRQALYAREDRPELLDIGDVRVIPHLLHDKYLNSETLAHCREALYGRADTPLPASPLSIAEQVCDSLFARQPGTRIFALGGDHSVSYPLARSWIRHRRALGKRVGIVHFDAHTDLLERRLGIDICFATWTAQILPLLEKPAHLVQLGIRSSGKPRAHWEARFGIRQYWAEEIRSRGIEACCDEAVARLKAEGVEEIYISFDIDAVDAAWVSATGTPEPEGMTPDEALAAIARFGAAFRVTGADLVEVAPFISARHAGSQTEEPDSTLKVAAELGAALLRAL